MKPVHSSDLEKFVRQYRWAGARLARVRYQHRRGQLNVDVVLVIRRALKDLSDTARPVRLHLRFIDVEECRFQKRTGRSLATLPAAHFAFLQGAFFATFDTWALESHERPGVHDFRGSEAYLVAKDLHWGERALRTHSEPEA